MYKSWLPQPTESSSESSALDTTMNSTGIETVVKTPVPEGRDGHTMIHAYTVLNKLRLSLTWFAYKRDIACRYYDEVKRILELIGSVVGDAGEMRIKDIISF